MHPILFRIPLPAHPVPWAWLLWIAAGLAAVFAVAQIATRHRTNALIAGGVAVLAVGVKLFGGAIFHANLDTDTWDMGPIPIYSYGVMLGLSLVVGWYLTLGLAEREGLPKETMANCYVITAIAAVAGSRVLYILTNLNEFDSLGSMFAMRRGGLVAYGGFLGGFLGSYFFLRRHKIALMPWADVAVPSLASGLMITRIGCYLFGCDFGRPLAENAPGFLKTMGTFPHWGAGTLDHGEGAPAWYQHVKEHLITQDATHSLPVHPTQIYESLVGAGLLVLLLTARKYQKFRGQIFLLFTFAYGVCRYLLEVIRDDAERGSLPPSLPQHVLIPFGLAILSAGYVIGFSHAIKDVRLQRVTQVLAFVPPVVLYLLMKPETFGAAENIELSTSQAVALSTGFAASVAFAVFYKAALAHPEAAMALNLPVPADPSKLAEEDDDGEDEEPEEERPRVKRTAAGARKKPTAEPPRKKKRPAVKKEPAESASEEEAGGEADPKGPAEAV
jgi:phosphatidylglycerol---prolipoprotein diacylglyceryl transferase